MFRALSASARAGVRASSAQSARFSTARVALFTGAHQPFEFQNVALPETLKEGEVLVQMHNATICGSDLHTFTGMRKEPTPSVLGHEGVGEVIGIGTDVLAGTRPRLKHHGLRVGDRVTWSVADSCGQCPECNLHKLPQKCKSLFKYILRPSDSGAPIAALSYSL